MIRFNIGQCNIIRFNVIRFNIIRYNVIRYNIIQYNLFRFNIIRFGFPKGKGLVSQRGRAWFPKEEGRPVRGTEGNTQVTVCELHFVIPRTDGAG